MPTDIYDLFCFQSPSIPCANRVIIFSCQMKSPDTWIYCSCNPADCVDHSIMIAQLHKYGLDGSAVKHIKSYLYKRRQVTIKSGRTQESIPVPLLLLPGFLNMADNMK